MNTDAIALRATATPKASYRNDGVCADRAWSLTTTRFHTHEIRNSFSRAAVLIGHDVDMQSRQALFLAISARLTGFEVVELEGTGMTPTYFDTLAKNTAPEVLGWFFEEVASILALPNDDAIDAAIRSNLIPDSSYDATAKAIILMWYTGEWYTNIAQPASIASAQIDGASYVQGLMWNVAEAHPPGAKQPGYGSWAEPPIRTPA